MSNNKQIMMVIQFEFYVILFLKINSGACLKIKIIPKHL